MTFATQIAVIFTALSTAGVVFDKLLVRRHKTVLHTKLVALWSRVDDIKIGDLPGAVSAAALSRFERVFGTSLFGWRVILLSLIGSWLLTTAESIVGDYLWGHLPYRVWHDRLPFWPWYVAEYVFNTATLVLLLLALRRLRSAEALRSFIVTLTTVALAFILAVFCFESGYWTCTFASQHTMLGADLVNRGTECSCHVDNATLTQAAKDLGVPAASISVDRIGTTLMQFSDISSAYLLLVTTGDTPVRRVLLTATTSSGTHVTKALQFRISRRALLFNGKALIAVALLLLVIGVAVLAKLLLSAARFVSLSILEAVTEPSPESDPKNFMPGTLLGAVLGLIAAMVRALTEVIRLQYF